MNASPVLRLKMLLPRGDQRLDLRLPAGTTVFTPNGRSALLMTLRSLGVPHGGRVLLPAYLCDSVVAPVVAHGAVPLFYPVSSRLEPDLHAVKSLLRDERPALMVVIHYFGFPSPAWNDLRRLAGEFGVPILEDCAHALYSQAGGQPLGSQGDAAIFSLRKTLPVPEGGVLVLHHPADGLRHRNARWRWQELGGFAREAVYRLDHSLGLSLRARLLAREGALEWARQRNVKATQVAEEGLGYLSRHIVGGTDAMQVVAQRRRNFLHLGKAIQELQGWLCPLYEKLPEGVCPIGFPVLVEERDTIRQALARQGIGVRMFWDVLPPEVPLQEFPESAYLRDRILVLPVHQDLAERHIDHLVTTLRTLWSKR